MKEKYNSSIIINKIELLCKEQGVSINKMLNECKLSKSIVDNMKKGSVPSVDKLQKIAEYFKCSIDYLIGNKVQEEQLDKTDQEILVLARKTKDLPEEDKKKFLEVLRGSVNAFLKEDNK